MKKLLPVVALVILFSACKGKKEDKKPEETTTTTPAATEPATTTPAATETPATAGTGVPTFSDPEVQKFANDYGAFMAEYKAGMKDPAKLAGLSKSMQEWAGKAQKIGMKLATTPDEAKKWAEWTLALSKEMMPAMPK
jgi:hypothetical protein